MYTVEKAVLGQIFLSILKFFCHCLPPMQRAHSFIHHQHYIILTTHGVIK